MVTAQQSKAALVLFTDKAVDTAEWLLGRSQGTFEQRRKFMLDTVPELITYYSDGSAALAADYYDDARDVAGYNGYSSEAIVLNRTVRIRRGVAWASAPLLTRDEFAAAGRFAELVQSELVRPYRDTILTNQRRDPKAIGWRRIASSTACGFCKALADKGAVYKRDTATFAAHDNCKCTAAVVFLGGQIGPEASAMQYMASGRYRTEKEKAAIRDWAASYE